VSNPNEPPRLQPREPHRPPVSPETATVFGRPDGVDGAFAPRGSHGGGSAARDAGPQVADPDPVLAEAFGRTTGDAESLQRDPDARYGESTEPESEPDPWRDPHAPATLTDPAVSVPADPKPASYGPKIGVRELLFGDRVSWRALAALAAVAVVIAVVGGFVGRWTAEVTDPLHSKKVSISTKQPNSGDPKSRVTQVVNAMSRAVVSIEVRTDDALAGGSGVVIDKNGYILTNYHVVMTAAADKSAVLSVLTYDSTRLPARIVGTDPATDLAVVKVDDVDNLAVAQLGDSDKLQIGEEVVAFGQPEFLRNSVTSGIVSAVHRPYSEGNYPDSDQPGAVLDAIQTDAAVNHGNSGGPLVDMDGHVIGINTAGLMGGQDGGSIGLNFAIPSNEASDVAQSLIRDGKITHPQLGASVADVANKAVSGAQVKNVVSGSPADRAGLKEGDVITAFDGRSTEDSAGLSVAVRKSSTGKPVPFTYWRDGRSLTGSVTLTAG